MTDQMTPDEAPGKARALLDGTTPGPWEWEDCIGDGGVRHMALRNPAGEKAIITEDAESYQSGVTGTPEDLRLTAAAPVLAAMIAGMREEWGVHVTGYPKNIADWAEICDTPEDRIAWHPDEEAAEEFAVEREDEGFDTRLVRRYVTTEEEA